MWFKRKTKNRRNERDSVLEVKMRSRDASRARLRVVTGLVGAVGGTTLGVLVIWQAYQWALQRFVYGNDAYAIRRIELRHHGRLLPDQIRRWAGVETGQNLLAVDLDRVRHDLEMIPWVERLRWKRCGRIAFDWPFGNASPWCRWLCGVSACRMDPHGRRRTTWTAKDSCCPRCIRSG